MVKLTKRDDPPLAILGECARCRLVIYETDPHETISEWPWEGKELFHSGCAWRAQAIHWQTQLDLAVSKLRLLRFRCVVTLERPQT